MNQEIIEKALKNGIVITKDNKKIKINYQVLLTYIKYIDKFILAFGDSMKTADFVFVDDYGKTWELADGE